MIETIYISINLIKNVKRNVKKDLKILIVNIIIYCDFNVFYI